MSHLPSQPRAGHYGQTNQYGVTGKGGVPQVAAVPPPPPPPPPYVPPPNNFIPGQDRPQFPSSTSPMAGSVYENRMQMPEGALNPAMSPDGMGALAGIPPLQMPNFDPQEIVKKINLTTSLS